MSQRHSEYARQERDLYETPAWVTEAVLPYLNVPPGIVWEPACGSGKMSSALAASGLTVVETDISKDPPLNFLTATDPHFAVAIVTNPPFGLAQEFIEHALRLMKPCRGLVAMLLRTDYDHAKTRQHLFSGCDQFATKLVLTKRIVWFERPGAAPSFNHAWFIWDWKHQGPPTLAYGP